MTPIQQRTDDLNWMSLEGKTLDNDYVLGQCLGADEHRVVFKAQMKAGDSASAVVKLYRATPHTSDEQIALWESIRDLRHPNLMAILGTGRTKLEGQDLVYVAVEAAQERLDSIVRERPLDTTESGELVMSMCRGLEGLHEAGFVHGLLSPEHVLAVNDAVKLSTDGIRRVGSGGRIGIEYGKYQAPESAHGNATPEADVWCLGATLYEAMTQKQCVPDCRSEAAMLPAPFGTIVHRCLYSSPEARCTVSDVVQLCGRRERAFAAVAGADLVGAGSKAGRREAAPINSEESLYFVPRSASSTSRETRQFASGAISTGRPQWRIWALLAIVLLVVAILIWLARPRKSGAPIMNSAVTRSVPSQTSGAPAQKPTNPISSPAAPGTSAVQLSTRERSAPSPGRKPGQVERTGSAATQTHFANGPIWRVVTYTYNSSADAENQANSINKRHPDLNAGVFAPNGNAGPYLVVIGGQMSREDAVTLRQKALSLGLPRDSYLQNYKQ
jgi:serine/threonine protein kinase